MSVRQNGSGKSGGRDAGEPLEPRSLSTGSGVPTAGDVAEEHDAKNSDVPSDNAGSDQGSDQGSDHGSDAESGPGAVPQKPAETEGTQTMDKRDDDPPRKPRRRARETAHQAVTVLNYIRSKVATLVWIVALLCAVALALAAVLVALEANPANGIVSFFNDLAHKVDGPFADMFTFSGKDAAKKEILVNWGIGAAAYLVVGRILERIIRP